MISLPPFFDVITHDNDLPHRDVLFFQRGKIAFGINTDLILCEYNYDNNGYNKTLLHPLEIPGIIVSEYINHKIIAVETDFGVYIPSGLTWIKRTKVVP